LFGEEGDISEVDILVDADNFYQLVKDGGGQLSVFLVYFFGLLEPPGQLTTFCNAQVGRVGHNCGLPDLPRLSIPNEGWD
jgi:hypothetical protein